MNHIGHANTNDDRPGSSRMSDVVKMPIGWIAAAAAAAVLWSAMTSGAVAQNLTEQSKAEPAAGVAEFAEPAQAAGPRSIDQWVDQIRGGSFIERERAAAELYRLGPSIVAPLMSRIERESDSETVLRLFNVANKLKRQNDLAMEKRFIVGLDASLPGWRWFAGIMGDNPATRKLFVDIRRQRPGMTAMLDGTSQDRSTVLSDSVGRVNGNRFRGRIDLEAADLLGVLLPLADPLVSAGIDVDHLVLNFHASEVANRLMSRPGTRQGVRKLFSRWIERTKPPSHEYALIVGHRLALPAGVELAREMLKQETVVFVAVKPDQWAGRMAMNKPSSSMLRLAMQMIAIAGEPEDATFLARLMPDVRLASGQSRIDGVSYTTTIGDCAAAAIVAVRRWRPSELGLSELGFSPATGFVPDRVGFADDDPESRRQSREKIRQRIDQIAAPAK